MPGANWYRDGTGEWNSATEYAARGRGAKLASICGTGGTRAEAIQADLD